MPGEPRSPSQTPIALLLNRTHDLLGARPAIAPWPCRTHGFPNTSYWAGACQATVPNTDGVVNRAEVRVIGTVVRVPGSVRKRYGIFTITRSFGCVSVPNGEPAIGESNPVEALMVKTEMSPPTLLVTSRNFPEGSIATLEGALFAVKGEPGFQIMLPSACCRRHYR